MPSARNYEALYKLSRSLHVLDKHLVMERVVNAAAAMVHASWGGAVLLHDERTIDSARLLENDLNPRPVPDHIWQTLLLRGLVGFVYHGQRTIILRNIATDPRWLRLDELPQRGSAVGLPFNDGAQILGVLLLVHARIDYFDPARVALLEEVAELAGVAIHNALKYDAASLNNLHNGQSQDDNLPTSRAATSTTQSPF